MATARQDVTPYKGHRNWYIAGLIAAVLVFGTTAYIASQGTVFGWEVTWFRELNNQSEGWYRWMVIVTFFGSTLWAPIAVGLAFLARLYRLALRLALTILGSYTVVYLAKHFIERERPLGLLTDVHARVVETGMGFPSGHATLATVITLTLLPYIAGKWRWLLPVPIVLVCISRLYLGVHLPLDLIGGVAIGTAAVAFVRILPQPLRVLLRID